MGGLRFSTSHPLAAGDTLSVQLRREGSAPIEALARVVRSEPAENGQTSAGIQFLELAKEHQRELRQLYLALERKNFSWYRALLLGAVLPALVLAWTLHPS